MGFYNIPLLYTAASSYLSQRGADRQSGVTCHLWVPCLPKQGEVSCVEARDEGLEAGAGQSWGVWAMICNWVLMVLGLLTWCCQSLGFKANHLCCVVTLLKDKERACNLPTWVHFPDTKRGEWLNKTAKHTWSFICQFTELFWETTELALQGANAPLQHLQLHKSKRGSSTS